MSDSHLLKQLVNSLTPREKSNFNNTISGKGIVQRRIKNIFDNLVDAKVPLMKELERREYYRHKLLLKKQLLDFLLDDYESGASYEAELHRNLRLSAYLITRDQFEMAFELLDETKRKADEFDFHMVVLECLRLEGILIRNFLKADTSIEMDWIFHEKKCRLAMLDYETMVSYNHDKLFIQIQNGKVESQQQMEVPAEYLTHTCQRLLLSDKARLAKFNNEKAENKKYRKQIVELFEEKPLRKEIFPTTYISILSNYASALNSSKEADIMLEIIDKIKHFKPSGEFEKVSSFQLVRYLELLVFIGQNEFKKASALESETERKLGNYVGKLDKTFEITIYFNLAASLWINKEPTKSIKWIQKIIKYKYFEARTDIQRFAYVMAALLYADTKNAKELEKLCQMAYKPGRFKIEIPSDYCKLILLVAKIEEGSKKVSTEHYLNQMESIIASKDFIKSVGVDELKLWIMNRKTGKSLEELAKEM
ncbi:MAG: hypothetical protein K1X82_06590 [Bacteroidia bacterium]|nr:hypothetical protein [Bacteroidia bacterium]